jgi:hypothetical protein
MSAPQFLASIADLQAWASTIMLDRDPDFVIGDDYLRRWWIVPRNDWCNVYLHHILKSDDDRALHDHPWDNVSLIIKGGYLEHVADGSVIRRVAGDVVQRSADTLHRLEVDESGAGAVSLFMTGPKVREWGFACPQGWRHWRDFVDPIDSGKPGRGCGE